MSCEDDFLVRLRYGWEGASAKTEHDLVHDFDLHGRPNDIQRVRMVAAVIAEIIDYDDGVALRLSVRYPAVFVLKIGKWEAEASPIGLRIVNIGLQILILEKRTLVALTPWSSI